MSTALRLTISKFFSSFYFALPIQTLFLVAKGLPFSQIMILESVLLVSIFLFEVPTGILGDKIGRKWSIIFGSICQLIAWIPWFLANGFVLFAVSFFISGIGIAFQSGSDQALIFDCLKAEGKESAMQKIFGRYFASMSLATACAGLISALLIKSGNLENFYLLYKATVVMQILGTLILFTVKEENRSSAGKKVEKQPQSNLKFFLSSTKEIFQKIKLRKLTLLYLTTLPFSYVLIYIFQPYFQASSVPLHWYGYAVMLASLFSTFSKSLAYKLEQYFGVKRGLLIITITPAILWLTMGLIFTPIAAVLIFILNDSASNARSPVFADYLNKQITSTNRATVLSIISVTESLYYIITRPIIGFIADYNLSYAFFSISALIILGVISLYPRMSNETV